MLLQTRTYTKVMNFKRACTFPSSQYWGLGIITTWDQAMTIYTFFGICSQKAQDTSTPIALLQTFLGVNILTRLLIYSIIFGLNHVQDTPIGDAAIRGISGEKKCFSYVSFHSIYFTLFFSWRNFRRISDQNLDHLLGQVSQPCSQFGLGGRSKLIL